MAVAKKANGVAKPAVGGKKASPAKGAPAKKTVAAAPVEEESDDEEEEEEEEESDGEADEDETAAAPSEKKGQMALFSDDEEDDEGLMDDELDGAMEVDDEEEEEEEDSDAEMDIEAAQKRADKYDVLEKEAAEAEKAEQQRQQDEESDIEGDEESGDEEGGAAEEEGAEPGVLPKSGTRMGKAVDLKQLKAQMQGNVKMLCNWKIVGRQQARSRDEILEELIEGVTMYYGYSEELARYWLHLFKPDEAIEFFEANEQQRPTTIRINTLKTRRQDCAKQLTTRGVNCASIGDWTKDGLKVYDCQVPLGATPEYLCGHYMIQSASSFVPVLALGAQINETILDMAAAPGGKTTHIGQCMQNTGTLFANDLKKERCQSLMANIHRLGLTNAVVTNYDGLKLKAVLPKLDRVLLDAPCTGSGIIARDPSIKVKRTVKDFEEHCLLQKQLLLTAIDMVDANSATGGVIVYSTCSIAIEEDEKVVDYALRNRNVELVDFSAEVPFGVPGLSTYRGLQFHPSLKLAKRYYPHVHNMDGFFVAKFRKVSNEIPKKQSKKDRSARYEVVTWGEDKWASMQDTVLEFPDAEEEAAAQKKAAQEKSKAADADLGFSSSDEEADEDGDNKKKKTLKKKSKSASTDKDGKKGKKGKKDSKPKLKKGLQELYEHTKKQMLAQKKAAANGGGVVRKADEKVKTVKKSAAAPSGVESSKKEQKSRKPTAEKASSGETTAAKAKMAEKPTAKASTEVAKTDGKKKKKLKSGKKTE
eukprot:gene134-221_t